MYYKKLISIILVAVFILSLLTACGGKLDENDSSSTNATGSSDVKIESSTPESSSFSVTQVPTENNSPLDGKNINNMAKYYYDYVISQQKIETKASEMTGGSDRSVFWNINELKYYVGDFNSDGIIDLAISASGEDYGNGVVIYTYKNEKVVPLFSFGMPYSAGSETCTLAVRNNGEYGIFTYEHNSTQPFTFWKIDKAGNTQPILQGACFDEKGNPTNDMVDFDRICEVAFYDLEEICKGEYGERFCPRCGRALSYRDYGCECNWCDRCNAWMLGHGHDEGEG